MKLLVIQFLRKSIWIASLLLCLYFTVSHIPGNAVGLVIKDIMSIDFTMDKLCGCWAPVGKVMEMYRAVAKIETDAPETGANETTRLLPEAPSPGDEV